MDLARAWRWRRPARLIADGCMADQPGIRPPSPNADLHSNAVRSAVVRRAAGSVRSDHGLLKRHTRPGRAAGPRRTDFLSGRRRGERRQSRVCEIRCRRLVIGHRRDVAERSSDRAGQLDSAGADAAGLSRLGMNGRVESRRPSRAHSGTARRLFVTTVYRNLCCRLKHKLFCLVH